MLRRLLALVLLLTCLPAFAQFAPSIGTPNTSPDYTMPAGKIYIDTTTIPRPRLGMSVVLIDTACTGVYGAGSCTGANVPASGGGNSGSFRITCKLSHMSFDDPIVWPGMPGRTHLHQFFGNDTTFGGSTLDTLDLVGNSNCPGGIANRTGYWTPALIYERPGNVRNGEVQLTSGSNFYYKRQQDHGISAALAHTGNWSGVNCPLASCALQWPARGVRMIAGNASNTGAGGIPGRFQCLPLNNAGWDHIPSAAEVTAVGGNATNCADFEGIIEFQGCWNGVDKYLPGSAHVKNITANLGCDDIAFPVMFPLISFNIHWAITSIADFDFFRLSSDQPKATASGACNDLAHNFCAGATWHGDWSNGWPIVTNLIPGYTGTITDAILAVCLVPPPNSNEGNDCHDNLIGSPAFPNAFTDGLSHPWYKLRDF